MTRRIPGLEYHPDYVDQDTHDRLLSSVDQHAWQTTLDHHVQVYGYRYHRGADAAHLIGELPAWSTALATRLHRDGFFAVVPNQLVANAYEPGTGFFDHIDQAVFGDVVVSISLESTCVMRFTHLESSDSKELLLEPRSVLVLAGEARWHWKHGIPARTSDLWDGHEYVRRRRVSLTFRAVPDADAGQ
jgi:alkylated DNA repair dioxygenase AlkB